MRIYHFTILFAGLLIAAILLTGSSGDMTYAMREEKQELDAAVDAAVLAGTRRLAADLGSGAEPDKEAAVERYFEVLFASLGISDAPQTQKTVRLCTPVILVTDTDGFYAYYHETAKDSSGKEATVLRWSRKTYYTGSDKYFSYTYDQTGPKGPYTVGLFDRSGLISGQPAAYDMDAEPTGMRKSALYQQLANRSPDALVMQASFRETRDASIAAKIEEALAWYCGQAGLASVQNGVGTEFSVPSVETEDVKSLYGVSMVALFQGYPYRSCVPGSGGPTTYSRMAYSNASVIAGRKCWLDMPARRYHKEGCPLLPAGHRGTMESVDTEQDAARRGCYACPVCGATTGACAP